jgi:hypothetical protein
MLQLVNDILDLSKLKLAKWNWKTFPLISVSSFRK